MPAAVLRPPEGRADRRPALLTVTILTQLLARPDARADLEAWIRRHGSLASAAASHPEAVALRGRGLVHVVPRPGTSGAAGERWVVRHYRRGGAVASWLGDRYLRLGTPRPVQEYAVAEALAAAGVPTPLVVGAAVYRAGAFYRGDLVTEFVTGSRDLAAVLFGAAQPGDREARAGSPAADGPDFEESTRDAMTAAGRLLRLAHERGLDHPDLNIKNILVVEGSAGPEALVVDLDRARMVAGGVGDRRRRRMVERFWRSVRKWEAATGWTLPAAARAAWWEGYTG